MPKLGRSKKAPPKILTTPIRADKFPEEARKAMINAALEERVDAVFALYGIPSDVNYRWEMLAIKLLCEKYPGFKVLEHPPGGRPPEAHRRKELGESFEAFQAKHPRYKTVSAAAEPFLKHSALCNELGITSQGGLENALRRARKERRDEEWLVQQCALDALGLRLAKIAPSKL